ncbi:SDR family oxidoreductase [Nakamurella deserti]|uniref:SDR family oxidoreductase n=1 Tax=Nakamurella deserti TaxID=2164074 RepID=UPI000DBE3B38|nr:SDR family oxidoreductase [Nakamurella deserti]
MTIVVTGATGHLGRHTVEALLDRGVPAGDIVATGRNTDALAALAERGVRTAVADFADPASLKEAFAGADAVLLVSADVPGTRVELHRNAVEAAAATGVQHLVYTSAPNARETELILAPEHKATEEIIEASGVPATILRNGWYTENYLPTVEQARATGQLVASVGEGRVASASRRDYAEAAAVVLTTPGHQGAVYELSGDTAWHFDDLADAIGQVVGRQVEYVRVTPDEQRAALIAHGLDEGTAGFVVALDGDTRKGLLGVVTGDLSRLIGRPTTPLLEGLRAAV